MPRPLLRFNFWVIAFFFLSILPVWAQFLPPNYSRGQNTDTREPDPFSLPSPGSENRSSIPPESSYTFPRAQTPQNNPRASRGGEAPQSQAVESVNKGLPLWMDGLDPVSYVRQGVPLQGVEKFSFADENFRYRYYFASEDNLNAFRFQTKPEERAKFLPAFMGHDPYFLSIGQKETGNPQLYQIHTDGRFYWFYSPATFRLWLNRPDEYNKRAMDKWTGNFNCGYPPADPNSKEQNQNICY